MNNVLSDIFFDLDGTLFESEADIRSTWAAVLSNAGIDCPEFNAVFRVGPSLHDMLHELFPDMDDATFSKLALDFKNRYDNSSLPETKPYPHIDAWIRRLHDDGYRMYSMTNKRLRPTRMLIERSGWSPLFNGLVCSDSFKVPHPSKATLLCNAIEHFNLSPSAVVMIGDTPEDIAAGRGAQCRTCFCEWGYGDISLSEPDQPDLRITADMTLKRDILTSIGVK